jgi:hypothetical protein
MFRMKMVVGETVKKKGRRQCPVTPDAKIRNDWKYMTG